MDKLNELITQLHPAIMFAVGGLFALLRMFTNGLMYKHFGLYKEAEYLKGIPFQMIKIIFLIFGFIVVGIALFFTPYEQTEIVIGLYATLVIASVTYDIGKLIGLYNRLQKLDNEGDVE